MEPPPDLLRVSVHAACDKMVFPYETSSGDDGELVVEYGFELAPADVEALDIIGLGVAIYLGQLALARRIELDFSTTSRAVELAAPLVEMLYDVRSWKDDIALQEPPEIVFRGRTTVVAEEPELRHDRSLLLWSGGKDSTLAALLLPQNGYEVCACHIAANPGVADFEEAAVSRLEPMLGISAHRVGIRHARFLEFSSRYAKNWNVFPLSNTVPFGRDLLLALVATPVARRVHAGKVSLAHDHECRHAFVEYRGKHFPRNDVESAEGALALERYIEELLLPGSGLLPPVAGITGFRILYEMLVNLPSVMRQTSFCFWGGNCGRCAKCLRYYLAQRVFGGPQVLEFEVNPLAAGACPELEELLANRGATGMLFEREVFYCLGRLVQYGDIRPGEDRLMEFRDTHYFEVAPRLDSLETELMAPAHDLQLPRRWQSLPTLTR